MIARCHGLTQKPPGQCVWSKQLRAQSRATAQKCSLAIFQLQAAQEVQRRLDWRQTFRTPAAVPQDLQRGLLANLPEFSGNVLRRHFCPILNPVDKADPVCGSEAEFFDIVRVFLDGVIRHFGIRLFLSHVRQGLTYGLHCAIEQNLVTVASEFQFYGTVREILPSFQHLPRSVSKVSNERICSCPSFGAFVHQVDLLFRPELNGHRHVLAKRQAVLIDQGSCDVSVVNHHGRIHSNRQICSQLLGRGSRATVAISFLAIFFLVLVVGCLLINDLVVLLKSGQPAAELWATNGVILPFPDKLDWKTEFFILHNLAGKNMKVAKAGFTHGPS